jgi:hypothetical protein
MFDFGIKVGQYNKMAYVQLDKFASMYQLFAGMHTGCVAAEKSLFIYIYICAYVCVCVCVCVSLRICIL